MKIRKVVLSTILIITVKSVMAFREGSRIMWDYSTLYRVSQGTYPRFERLQSGLIMCVGEDSNGIFCMFSSSEGKRWTSQIRIKNNESNKNMAVPEVIQLSNGKIFVTYNGRVKVENSSTRFDIRIISSNDNGLSWTDEKIIYQAGTTFGTGCWEPVFLDKGNGELQVYFANEAPFPSNNDQEIAVVKSFDYGITWTSASRVSYRQGARDGMPVPVKLKNNKGYAVAIEDYYNSSFIPAIISSTDANWSSFVDGNSAKRWFSSTHDWLKSSYNGAPYLVQMPGGETVLSFMSTNNRSSDEKLSDMIVGIGNEEAKNFNNYTKPFNIPNDKYALWNSLFVKNDSTLTAISATNAFPYSGENASWIMAKDGYILQDLVCAKKTPMLDGVIDPNEYGKQNIFIGAYSENNIRIKTAYDNQYLYISVNAKDKKLWQDSDHPLNDDGVRILLDPTNKNAIRNGVFSFAVDLNGNIKVQEGNASGFWSTKTVSGINVVKKISGTINNNSDIDEGYTLEIAIPWSVLGVTPIVGSGFGINFCMYSDADGAGNDYSENVSGNEELTPSTWCKITPDLSNTGLSNPKTENNLIIKVLNKHLFVKTKNNSIFSLKVYDNIGRLVFWDSNIEKAEVLFENKGLYILQSQYNDCIQTEKVLI